MKAPQKTQNKRGSAVGGGPNKSAKPNSDKKKAAKVGTANQRSIDLELYTETGFLPNGLWTIDEDRRSHSNFDFFRLSSHRSICEGQGDKRNRDISGQSLPVFLFQIIR